MGFTLNQLEQERQIRKLQKKEDKDTKDYEQLSNLPKINNVELKGDKTTSDLGINADNVMLSDGVTSVEDALDATAHIPSSSDTLLGTITAGDSNSFAVNSNGFIAIYCSSGSSQKTFSAIIRDSVFTKYGIYITATLPAYNNESIGGLFVKKGRTYAVRNTGSNDITVYLCT